MEEEEIGEEGRACGREVDKADGIQEFLPALMTALKCRTVGRFYDSSL